MWQRTGYNRINVTSRRFEFIITRTGVRISVSAVPMG